MYFIDFFKSLFNKSHIGTLIWMILNLLIIVGAFGALGSVYENVVGGAVFGLVIYFLSLLVALSPVGEWMMRLQTGCKSIDKYPEIKARLMPLFEEAHQRAKALNSSLSGNVKLYVSGDDEPNAFATGRATVCVTSGLLKLSDDDIKGIIGHELGHLAHKDTYLLQAITISNLFVNAIFVIAKFVTDAFIFITRFITHAIVDSWIAHVLIWIVGSISKIVVDWVMITLMSLWTRLGVAVCMASSRSEEYGADRFSCDLGYGRHLAHALSVITGGRSDDFRSLWAAISSSHPDTQKRIQRINEYISSGNNTPMIER